MRNIIKMMQYNGYSQILRISLKTEKSFIARPWCLQPIVGLECIHWGWSAAINTVRSDSYLAWVRSVISTIRHHWRVSRSVSTVHGTGTTVNHPGPTVACDWFGSWTPDDPVSEDLDDLLWRVGFHAATFWRSLRLRHETYLPKPAPWTSDFISWGAIYLCAMISHQFLLQLLVLQSHNVICSSPCHSDIVDAFLKLQLESLAN